jgi:thiamine biosynthesis lipoprotein
MKTLMDRRTFIQSLCLLCSGWTAKSWAAFPNQDSLSSSLHRVSESKTHMGTFVTITLFHPSQEKAGAIAEAAFLHMEKEIHLYNRHEEGSPLSYLNRQGFLNNPPPELLAILERARELHSRSSGVFDVTIKPVLDLYEEAFLLGRLPESAAVGKTLPRVGFSNLKINGKKITFQKEGMGITLDGLAKGTVIDGTIEFLRKNGIKHALVEAGGDLRVIGGRGLGSPWRIAVYDPHEINGAQERIALTEGAVATSGCYFVYYDPRQDHFHILSPESGSSPPWSTSATVIAPTAEEADALATSLMLLSPEQALSFINRDKRLAAMIITREGQRLPSSRWPGSAEKTQWN